MCRINCNAVSEWATAGIVQAVREFLLDRLRAGAQTPFIFYIPQTISDQF
jgi:hypothetical protein